MDSSASRPSRCAPAGVTGTPITGSGVAAATMPGKCAAPPAPAMMTWHSYYGIWDIRWVYTPEDSSNQLLGWWQPQGHAVA